MLGISLICVGRMREKHYVDAFSEYRKRLMSVCKFELREIPEVKLPDSPSEASIRAALHKEADEIRKNIPRMSLVVAMCVEGIKLSSVDFAGFLAKSGGNGNSRICFVVGGSYGLHEGLTGMADMRLSMSDMTFPHHLARVMLAEQIYRGFSLLGGTKYHK